MKVKISLLALFLTLSLENTAQTFQEKFDLKMDNNDTTGMYSLVMDWKKTEPSNPEMEVAIFNYFAMRAFSEVVMLNTTPPEDGTEAIEVADSLGNISGYLYSVPSINDSLIQLAVRSIDGAIAKNPNRLDLRMGKIYITRESEHWDWMEKEIISTINQGQANKNSWYWLKNEPVEDDLNFLNSSLQEHFYVLFESGLPYAYEIIERCSKIMLEQDDANVITLSNVATCAMMKEQYTEALTYINKAYSINPNDEIIINNAGFCHWKLAHPEDAKRYYVKAYEIAKEGNNVEAMEYYQGQIDIMNKAIENR
jgi:tetratricopeptide (TPR) repeat protein